MRHNYEVTPIERKKPTYLPMSFILTAIFVVLKLTGQVDWSWLWVLSPLFIGTALIFLAWLGFIFLSVFLIAAVFAYDRWIDRRP